MKKVNNILARIESSLNGSLDGIELDNTDDVIEKNTVIEMIENLKVLVKQAQQQVKNLNIPAVSNNEISVCFGCNLSIHVKDRSNVKCLECINGDEKQTDC